MVSLLLSNNLVTTQKTLMEASSACSTNTSLLLHNAPLGIVFEHIKRGAMKMRRSLAAPVELGA